MSTDLVLNGEDVSLLSIADDPRNVTHQARQVAQEVMSLIMRKPKQVVFNGEKYFENDDWVMAGKMYGITVRAGKEPEYVEFGDVKGFKAEAEAYLVSTGQVIGKAYALCLDDEENWGARPKYEWKDVLDAEGKKIWEERLVKGKMKKLPKAEKIQVGLIKVPLFQLMSMAQTRASSKVLSMLLKFVPVLAGFKPVPAEEINGNSGEFVGGAENKENNSDDKPTRAKRKEPEAAKEPDKPRDPDCITQDQQKFLYIVAKKCKLKHEEVKEELQAHYKGKDGKPLQSSRDMLKKDFKKFLDSVDSKFLYHAPEPPEVLAQEEPGSNG
jgi:hypothetical protein